MPADRPDLSRTFAILLAGGRGTRLHELTAAECKPAIPFAGGHRIIDFALANAVRSGLDRLLVATQYRPQTLVAHLEGVWRGAFPAGLTIRDGREVTRSDGGYPGTAGAVAANLREIAAARPDEVLVLAGDHVYEMDYRPLVAAHRASGAAVTVASDTAPVAVSRDFGVIGAAAGGRIAAFLEKPAAPPPMPGDPGRCLVSMGIYVFSWPWLRAALLADAENPRSTHDFGHDILPRAVAEGVAFAWRPPGDGRRPFYWRDVGTLDAYRLAQLDFARPDPPCALPDLRNLLPAGAGRVFDPLQYSFELTVGGIALKAPRLRADEAGRWTLLEDCVVLPQARILPGARLSRAIVAPGTVVPGGLVVGEDPEEDARWFRRSAGGTTLVNTMMLARREARRGARYATAR